MEGSQRASRGRRHTCNQASVCMQRQVRYRHQTVCTSMPFQTTYTVRSVCDILLSSSSTMYIYCFVGVGREGSTSRIMNMYADKVQLRRVCILIYVFTVRRYYDNSSEMTKSKYTMFIRRVPGMAFGLPNDVGTNKLTMITHNIHNQIFGKKMFNFLRLINSSGHHVECAIIYSLYTIYTSAQGFLQYPSYFSH